MTGILCIETATDACSVACRLGGTVEVCHTVAAQQHNRLVFTMLRELLPQQPLRAAGVDLLAYGCGPGSFTGLRIAASAVQGLAFASGLPTVAISTLAVLAQSAYRLKNIPVEQPVLCLLDARLNEVYSAVYELRGETVELLEGPWVTAAEAHPEISVSRVHAVGSGISYLRELPKSLCEKIVAHHTDIFPHALDMLPLADEAWRRDELLVPTAVQPLYLRETIGWKKIAEQRRD